jgi:UDP-N-acetylmuramyl pentapeptide phosphotransferase/UDP-N-acetylglucosamine-1-phosphate transferase
MQFEAHARNERPVRGSGYRPRVQALPFVVALAVAIVLAPGARRTLLAGKLVRENYRGHPLAFPFGFVIAASATVALVPLALLERLGDSEVFRPELGAIAIYVLGISFLGLVDDVFSGPSRGWRGHGAAVAGGALSTGALKAAGALGLAMFALRGYGKTDGHWLLAVAVLVLATNLFNLLDLRPGRSVKVFVILGVGLMLAAWDTTALGALGLFVAPALVVGFYDVREMVMMGDAGSNVVGALAGFWMVLLMSTAAQIVALVVLLAITIYGEFRSISALVDRVPLLRRLDSFGRPG